MVRFPALQHRHRALSFGKLFFPKSDPLVGVLEAFAIYTVGFIARPIGAAIFGHFGDRIGRKATLIATLLMTGIGDLRRGLCADLRNGRHLGRRHPDDHPLHPGHRGRRRMGRLGAAVDGMGAHQQAIAASSPHGRNSAGRPGCCWRISRCFVFSAISGDQFLVWGWRIPFMLSIVMVAVGLYIRLGILETPVFRRLVAEERIERVPVLEVIKRQPKQIILSALGPDGRAGARLHLSRLCLYLRHTGAAHLARFPADGADYGGRWCRLSRSRSPAHLSDRFGRKRMYMIGSVATGIFGFIYFAMLNTMVPAWIFLAIMLSFVPHDLMYGPQARADRGMLHAAAALQRLLDRLSARLGHRRRSRAADRDGAARGVRIGLCDRRLYPPLRGRLDRRDGADAGSTRTATSRRSTPRRPVRP